MNLLLEAPRENGEKPLLDTADAPVDAVAAAPEAETLEDLHAEALSVDAIMTAARHHRDEASEPGMMEFQAKLHQKQFDSLLGNLATQGIGPEDIPQASLKYLGQPQASFI